MIPFELFVDMEYERRLRKEIMKNEGIKNYFHYWNKNYICRTHNNIGDIEKVIDNIDYMHSYQSRNEKNNAMANTSPKFGPEVWHFIALVNAGIPTEDEVYNENIQPLKEKIKTWKELREAIIVKIKYEKMKSREGAKNQIIVTPSFIIDLIEQGYVDKDGKTALAGLDNIAEFLYTKIENVTAEFLLRYFVQKDGSSYSQRTAQDAVKRNKTQ
ncbi:hypothetical protein FACS189485_01750 [Spirochaetia bacterium]|nr:hypothetical protein FACS189485_01750 [Spirochaetia bacterium]